MSSNHVSGKANDMPNNRLGNTTINFNLGGSPTFNQGLAGMGGMPRMGINNPMMGLTQLGQQSQMMSAMMSQMMTLMGMLLMNQMQSLMSSMANFGAGSANNSGLGNFLGSGGGGGGGGGQAPAGSASSGGGAAAPAGAKTGKLVDLGGGKKVDSSIADNVRRMIADAKKDGVNLQITSANRTRAEQEVLYQKYLNGTGNLAAKPGTSNHESGLAIDFTNTPGAFAWLAKNAGRYGLKNLKGEPWHYSPSGT
jgi:hypothetical protein